MAEYTYQLPDADLGELETQINAAGVPGLASLCFSEPEAPATTGPVVVATDADLSAGDKTTLDGVVAAHVPSVPLADRLNVID